MDREVLEHWFPIQQAEGENNEYQSMIEIHKLKFKNGTFYSSNPSYFKREIIMLHTFHLLKRGVLQEFTAQQI